MKKFYLVIALVIAAGAARAQNDGSSVRQIDNAVNVLAADLKKKIVDQKAQRVTLGQFTYRGAVTPFSAYWTNQLTEELAGISSNSFTLLSGGAADLTISGEIVVIANVIRVYTRLIRRDNRAVAAALHTNLERDGRIIMMLSSGGMTGSSGSSSSGTPDGWEPDGYDDPVVCETGFDNDAPVIERTLHEGDEDFFLIEPETSGQLVAETIGTTDTYIELYDAGNRELLQENDDGASNTNARVRENVQAGRRYIVKVRGYSSGDMGEYGFRAYLQSL